MVRHALRVLVAAGLIGLVAAAVAAARVPYPAGPPAGAWTWLLGAVLPAYLVGAVALALRPDHLTARWLAAVGSFLAIASALNHHATSPDAAGLTAVLNTLQAAAMLATAASITSLLVTFPDRAYRYRYQRLLVRLVWVPVLAIPAVWVLAHPTLYPSSFVWAETGVPNPWFVPALAPLGAAAEAGVQWRAAVWLLGAGALLVRYRRASPAVRERFQWPLGAAIVFAVFLGSLRLAAAAGLLPPLPQGLPLSNGWVPGLALLTGSMLVALLRHRLLEVDLWLRRLVLSGGASLVIAVGYLGLAGLLGLVAAERVSAGAGVLVTLVAVAAFEPVRRRIERRSRRWVFGTNRLQGDELLRRVGSVLEDTHDTSHLGATLASTIVDGLGLEWARISLSVEEGGPSVPVAAVGVGKDERVTPDLVVPLTHAGEGVGFIECGPKRDGDLSEADEKLLATVGRQAALAVRNAGLTAELEARLAELHQQAEELAASRSRIVQAQTNERRRIERDIHDGVQQEIVASIAKIRLARNQVERDPALAAATLVELQGHTKRTLENLRELSRGIHPLVLTHRGLVEALDAQAGRMPIEVALEVAPQVRKARYTEEIEAATYFVVSEGLTNVIKHAGTDAARVTLDSADGRLVVEVSDAGRGCDPAGAAGSGIVGLRDRVESLGGSLRLDSRPGAGAVLHAELPAHRDVVSHA